VTPGDSRRAFVRDALGIAMLVAAALALNRVGADFAVADLACDAASRRLNEALPAREPDR
jgi:hypothetical protein